MSMYLPNPDVQPTGSELAEFIDVPPTVRERTRETDEEDDRNHNGDSGSVRPKAEASGQPPSGGGGSV
jgi:hypothetical protein